MNGLALYFRYVSISIRSQLQYRASFIMQTLGHFLITGMEFLVPFPVSAKITAAHRVVTIRRTKRKIKCVNPAAWRA